MKKQKLLLIILTLMSGLAFSQVQDTIPIYVEQNSDSTFRIVQNFDLGKGATQTYRTAPVDTTTAARILFNLIHDNELLWVRGARNVLEARDELRRQRALTSAYGAINESLIKVIGADYSGIARFEYRQLLTGVWQVTGTDEILYFKFDEEGKVVQVDGPDSDKVVDEGMSGNLWVVTPESFIIQDVFPVEILPEGERFIKIVKDEDVFVPINSGLVFTKIK